ncbi:MAG: hypothetical protein RJA44_2327 [Pseudomonadota bacterium]
MSWIDKVLWSQGMFLQPHHFQQEARHVAHQLDVRLRGSQPHGWGFTELLLDDSLLAQGRIGIVRASGVLPDGTSFTMPQYDALPAPLEIPADLKGELIYLALPLSRAGSAEVDPGEPGSRDVYRYRMQTELLRDQFSPGDEPEAIQTAVPCLRLLRAKELTDAWSGVGVVRVLERRSDLQLVLDRSYIPPQTRLDASAQLSASATLLHGLVRQRAELLAGQIGQLGSGVGQMAEFLTLMALNRSEPWLRQLAGGPSAHPRELHLACLQLAGELASFRPEQRCASEYPLYRHDDLQACFVPVIEDLRRMLSTVIDRQAIQIELTEHRWGRSALIQDLDLLRQGALVLAANAQLPGEQMRRLFPDRVKLAPTDRIRALVDANLPGIALQILPTVPRQLPFNAGFHYYELERGTELWRQLEQGGALSIYFYTAAELPGLALQLWALRS